MTETQTEYAISTELPREAQALQSAKGEQYAK